MGRTSLDALDFHRGTAFFETAIWYLLQLNPIDRIVLGPLVTHLGISVAAINADALGRLWRNVDNNLTTGPPRPEPPAAGRPQTAPRPAGSGSHQPGI